MGEKFMQPIAKRSLSPPSRKRKYVHKSKPTVVTSSSSSSESAAVAVVVVVTSSLSPAAAIDPSSSSSAQEEPPDESYCICGEGYVGQMIACDQPDCPVQWFHFKCVGLLRKVTNLHRLLPPTYLLTYFLPYPS
jgi:hypothetical protein